MSTPPLHPSLAPVAFLLGRWEGQGAGSYPTIEDFTYGEALTFGHVGKPFLTYAQRTWHPATGAGMHVETGYVRVVEPEGTGPVGAEPVGTGPVGTGPVGIEPVGIEIVIAQPTGVTEVLEGRLVGTTITARTTAVGLSTTAKEVTIVERELRLDGDDLVVRLAMAAVGVELTHHLASRLAPVAD